MMNCYTELVDPSFPVTYEGPKRFLMNEDQKMLSLIYKVFYWYNITLMTRLITSQPVASKARKQNRGIDFKSWKRWRDPRLRNNE